MDAVMSKDVVLETAVVETIPTSFLDRLEAAKLSGIPVQVELANAEIAVWYARREGLVERDPLDIAAHLAGNHDLVLCEKHEGNRNNIWMFNGAQFLSRNSRHGGWLSCFYYKSPTCSFWDRLFTTEKSRLKQVAAIGVAPVEKLVMPMPIGVLLRLSELKKAGRFDHFLAIAPLECFAEPKHVDPIILGVIVAGDSARYFEIARW